MASLLNFLFKKSTLEAAKDFDPAIVKILNKKMGEFSGRYIDIKCQEMKPLQNDLKRCHKCLHSQTVYEMLTDDPSGNTLKELAVNLNFKILIKAYLDYIKLKNQMELSLWNKFLYEIGMRYMKVMNALKAVKGIRLWSEHLKYIQGYFGTSTTAFFQYIRQLFFLNLLISIIVTFVLVLPQLLDDTFRGKHINGTYISMIAFYGHYTSEIIEVKAGSYYDMPIGYLIVTEANFLISFVILSYSIASTYVANYIESDNEFKSIYVHIVFASWDYGIESAAAAKLRSKAIHKELQDLLGSLTTKTKHDFKSKVLKYAHLAIINFAIFCFYIAIAYTTDTIAHIIFEAKFFYPVQSLLLFAITVLICFSPLIFTWIGKTEWYFSPETKLYVALIRSDIVKITFLCILIRFWLITRNREMVLCWETALGTQILTLLIEGVLALFLFFTFGAEALWNYAHYLFPNMISPPEFRLVLNSLNVIYLQTLTWMGIFFAPALPLVMTVLLVMIFYAKRYSVGYYCVPALSPIGTAHIQTILLTFSFVDFMLVVLAHGYTIFVAEPSEFCGPYRSWRNCHLALYTRLIRTKETIPILKGISRLISSPAFMGIITVLLIILCYYFRVRAIAHYELLCTLRNQLIMQRRDRFILLKLFRQTTDTHASRVSVDASDVENVTGYKVQKKHQ